MRKRMLLLAAVLPAATGCYSYQATTLADVAPGASVRVRVSPEEAGRIAELRLIDDRLVPGTLLRVDDAAIMLDSPVAGRDPASATAPLTQRIEIRSDAIREVELRRFDRLRTGALVAAVAAGVGYVIAVQLDGGRNDDDDDPGPGNPELRRAPQIRFALPVRF